MSDVLVLRGHSSDMSGAEEGTSHGGVVQWDYENRDGVGDGDGGHCCDVEENWVEGFEDVLESGRYEAQLKILFENCDDSRRGRLGHSGLVELGEQLQLGSHLPRLLHLLLGDDVTATATFEEFKETLVMLLTSSRADACDEDEPADQASVYESAVEVKDDEVEVEPKYIKGGKRYGRRSRPESFAVDHKSHTEATNIASAPCGEFEEAVFVGTNGGTFEACALTEERVRFVCCGLGLDPERLCRDDAANLCVTLGVQQPFEDILPSFADDGSLDFSLLLKTLLFPQPRFPTSSTPYVQHTSHSCQEDQDRRKATQYQLFSASPEPLFSALDDGYDCVRAQDVLDLWGKHGVLNGEEVLKALGLAGEVMLSRTDLELALECELEAQRNSVSFAAIASHRAELQGMRCDLMQLGQERDKLKDDLDKAERRCSQLAFEMDEQQELIESLNSSRLGELVNEHQDQISSLRVDFAREREQAGHQMRVEQDRQEEEASSLRVEQALLQQHVSVLLRENSRLEGELLEMAGSLAKAERHANELQECRKQHLELDGVHAFCTDSFAGEENFALIIKNYKQQIRELQDRNDELQAKNEELQMHGGNRGVRGHEKRLRPEGDEQNSGIVNGAVSGILEGDSLETNVDVKLPNGIGPVEHRSASFSVELELEQLKEVHKLELQGLRDELAMELQVSKQEFEQLMAMRESNAHKALEAQLEELKLSKRLQVEVEMELVKTTEELQQLKCEVEQKTNDTSEVDHLAYEEELSKTRNYFKEMQEELQLLQYSNKATCDELYETKCALSLSQQETQNLQAALKEAQREIRNRPVVPMPGVTEDLGSVDRVRMEAESTNDLQDVSDTMNTEEEENFVQVLEREECCAQKVSDMVAQLEEEQERMQQQKCYYREKLEDSAVYKDLAEKRAAELDKQNEHLQVEVKTLQDEVARQQAKEKALDERLADVQTSVSRQYEKAKNSIRLETIAAHQELQVSKQEFEQLMAMRESNAHKALEAQLEELKLSKRLQVEVEMELVKTTEELQQLKCEVEQKTNDTSEVDHLAYEEELSQTRNSFKEMQEELQLLQDSNKATCDELYETKCALSLSQQETQNLQAAVKEAQREIGNRPVVPMPGVTEGLGSVDRVRMEAESTNDLQDVSDAMNTEEEENFVQVLEREECCAQKVSDMVAQLEEEQERMQQQKCYCREKLEDSAVYKDLAEKRAAELDKQNEHLQVEVKTLQDEVARQQAKEKALYERLADVQVSVSRQYEKAKNSIRLETIAAHQEAAARIIRLEVDVSAAEESVREMAAERIASLNEFKDLQSQNDRLLRLEWEHTLCREAKNKNEEKLQTLLHEVYMLNGNLREVSSQRDKLHSDILLIEQDKESLQKEVSRLCETLKALQDKVFNLEDVQSELEQAQNENVSLHEELSRMAQEQAELHGYEADLAKAQHTISQLEKEIKTREDQIVQLKAYHESLWKRTVVRMGEVEGNLKGMRAALQEKAAFLNEQHMGEREHVEERKPIDEETTVGLTRMDIFTKEKAELHIKDLYVENACLLRALQQLEQRHRTVERKNILLEEKVSALNKLLRRLVPEHILAGL